MTLTAAHFVRNVPSSELAEMMANPDSFRLLYFPIEGLGQTSRDILSYGEAKWESVFPENWGKQKTETPFGCVPVLYIVKDGKEAILSESTSIESYLASHFHLLGDNPYEEHLIRAFHVSSLSIMVTFGSFVTWNFPEVQEKSLELFKTQFLPNWIRTHERHLIDNGSNGHYLGDKLTLADIKTANVIDHFALQPYGEQLVALIKAAPALWKVKETVDAHPKLCKWRQSEDFKKLESTTKHLYSDPFNNVRTL
ncbi:hypothetical protein BGZ83_005367 [Gryganskiella cystojenkinii]|nr:hypothetical protein BGZ83_005367 [Gryganskiella cystojenkinii]